MKEVPRFVCRRPCIGLQGEGIRASPRSGQLEILHFMKDILVFRESRNFLFISAQHFQPVPFYQIVNLLAAFQMDG